MKKISVFIIIGILISPIVYINIDNALADSHTYYVANNGSDTNNGLSPSSPWRTIGKVNTALNSGVITLGDDIYFKRGDIFSGELNLLVGGSSSNYMIIGAYGTGVRPIIENSGASGNGNCIILWYYTSGYYTIQDLHFMDTTGTKEAISIYGDAYNKDFNNIIIRNVYGEGIGGDLIFMSNTMNYTIENCEGNECTIVSYGDVDNRQSNGRVLNCTVYNAVGDGFTLHRAGSDTTNDDAGSNHLFYNCTVYGCKDGFDISAGQNVILDSCRVWDCQSIGIIIDHDIENVTIQNCIVNNSNSSGIAIADSSNVIVRNNKVWNTTDGSALYIATSDNSYGWADEDGYIENLTVYNNVFIYPSTFTGTYTNRIISISYDFFSDTVIKNNIFASFNSAQPDRLYRVYGSGIVIPSDDDVRFDTNMWWHGSGSSTSKWWTGSSTLNLAQWKGYYPTDDFDNPEFNNVETGDLDLNVISPCIDAGAWLAHTVGSGTGTTITLDDASYFMDGYGMTDGDNIFVGDDINLLITNINYKSNQITVNRSITWSIGENVSLSSYSGDKSDIGAIEFIQNELYPVITNIFLTSSNPLDTDPLYGWVNVSCTVTDNVAVSQVVLRIHNPDGSWNNVSMVTRTAGKYYYRTTTAFSTAGNYSYNIWAKDISNNAITSSNVAFSMPANWDINKDGQITVLDLTQISKRYGESGPHGWTREDTNNDRNITVIDLVIVTNHYGENWFT